MVIELSQKNVQTIYDCLMDVVYRMRDYHKSYFEGRDVDDIECLANYIRFAKEQNTNSEGSAS